MIGKDVLENASIFTGLETFFGCFQSISEKNDFTNWDFLRVAGITRLAHWQLLCFSRRLLGKRVHAVPNFHTKVLT